IADGSFAQNDVLRRACGVARERGRLHLMGLVSAGGVHASMGHLRALTQLAYDAIVEGRAEHKAATGEAAVRAAYERGETDEFITPTLVGEEGRVREGDAVVFFNFRPDRARQLTRALGPRVDLTTLTEYQEHWTYPVAFPPERPAVTLASFLAERGVAQL